MEPDARNMPRRQFGPNERIIRNKNGLDDYDANQRDYYNYPSSPHEKLSLLWPACLKPFFLHYEA